MWAGASSFGGKRSPSLREELGALQWCPGYKAQLAIRRTLGCCATSPVSQADATLKVSRGSC